MGLFHKDLDYSTALPNSNLTDVASYIEIVTDADIAAELSGGGGIQIYGPDGTTPVPFGLLGDTNLAAGTVKAWILESPLTAGSGLRFRLQYGSGLTTSEDKAGVAAGYALFMDMGQDPSGSAPQMYDWKTETFVGTSNGSMTSGELVAGQVGKALTFDGSTQFIDLTPLGPGLGATYSASCIVNLNGTPGGGSRDAIYIGGDDVHKDQKLDFSGTTTPRFVSYYDTSNDVVSASALSIGTSYLLTVVRDVANSLLRIYINDTQINTSAISGTVDYGIGTQRSGIGGQLASNTSLNAIIDEARVAAVAWTADEIDWQYKTMFTNSDTFTLGSAVDEGGGGVIIQKIFNLMSGGVLGIYKNIMGGGRL